MTRRKPAETFSPGELLRNELKVRGWSKIYMANRAGISTERLAAMLKGDKWTADECDQIGAALGMSGQFWVNFQNSYEANK